MDINDKIKKIKFSRLSEIEKLIWETTSKLEISRIDGTLGQYHHYYLDDVCILTYSFNTKCLHFDHNWFLGKIVDIKATVNYEFLEKTLIYVTYQLLNIKVSAARFADLRKHNR